MPQAVLAALYLAGAPHQNLAGSRARWPRVLDVVRAGPFDSDSVAGRLRSTGLWDEAALVVPNLPWAMGLFGPAPSVLTAACPGYPPAWRGRLGAAAPPALWCVGSMPIGPALTVVGSRRPSASSAHFIGSLGRCLPSGGLGLVSGGACGVDRMAAAAALAVGSPVVEVLPCGLLAGPRCGFGLAGSSQLSVSAPGSGFSVAAAKERNALLYAFGGPSLVVQPRHGTGGTCTGACEALRRRLGVVAVWQPPTGVLEAETAAACAALVRLGALSFGWEAGEGVSGLEERLAILMRQRVVPAQPTLFGSGRVREAS